MENSNSEWRRGPHKSMTLPDNNSWASGHCWRYSFDLN